MKKNKSEIIHNIFFLPTIMVFFQFCFLSVALFNSGFSFEKKVLIVSFLLVCLWGTLFITDFIRNKNFKINIITAFLIILIFMFCFNLIRQSWFTNYLRIDAVQSFFCGKTFIDTLFHSAIAESIVTNGYPSIQQNASTFLAYHWLSHYVVVGISKIFAIPCFITYNYLFPIIFIPLMLYLAQKVIVVGKIYFSGISTINLIDYIILVGIVYGFVTKQQQSNLGCNICVALFNSESCLFAVILLLLYFVIINYGYINIKNFNKINLFILIPIFILFLFFAKISFGIIFALGTSYYVFRKYFLQDKKWLLLVEYCGLLLFCFLLVMIPANSSFGPVGEFKRDFIFFHYVRTECKNLFYVFLHYFFLFLPIVSTIILKRDIIFKNNLEYKKRSIFLEMCFLLMVVACLPGILINIHGGSAFYFVIPIYYLFFYRNINSLLSSIIYNFGSMPPIKPFIFWILYYSF